MINLKFKPEYKREMRIRDLRPDEFFAFKSCTTNLYRKTERTTANDHVYCIGFPACNKGPELLVFSQEMVIDKWWPWDSFTFTIEEH